MFFQRTFQVHMLLDLMPFYVEAGTVGAEYGIGGVLDVGLRVVGRSGDDILWIVAGLVAPQTDLEPSPTLGVGGQRVGVIPKLRCGNLAGQR